MTQAINQSQTDIEAHVVKLHKDRVTGYVLACLAVLVAVGALPLFCSGNALMIKAGIGLSIGALPLAALSYYSIKSSSSADIRSFLEKLDPISIELKSMQNEKSVISAFKSVVKRLDDPRKHLDVLARFPRTMAHLVVSEDGPIRALRSSLYLHFKRDQATAYQEQVDDLAYSAGYDARDFLPTAESLLRELELKSPQEITTFFQEIHDASLDHSIIAMQRNYHLDENMPANEQKVVIALAASGHLPWLSADVPIQGLIQSLRDRQVQGDPHEELTGGQLLALIQRFTSQRLDDQVDRARFLAQEKESLTDYIQGLRPEQRVLLAAEIRRTIPADSAELFDLMLHRVLAEERL